MAWFGSPDPLFHPYHPVGSHVPGYIPNEYSVPTLLSIFATGCASIFGLSYLAAVRTRPNIPSTELLTLLWFVLCGFIHTFFEGYYVYNFRAMGPQQHVFGQLWKEYALSDSRYLTKNAFVLCMETITAVGWGPLSFFVAYLIMHNHPLRHPMQIIVSLGQLYGDVLYYATAEFDHYLNGMSYCRPERYYFWVYYVFMNIFWIVIPLCLIVSSVGIIVRVFTAYEKVQAGLAANGMVKKAD